jgi:hypothetical protein
MEAVNPFFFAEATIIGDLFCCAGEFCLSHVRSSLKYLKSDVVLL